MSSCQIGRSSAGGVPIAYCASPDASRSATYLVAAWNARAAVVSRFVSDVISTRHGSLGEVAALFLKLGLIAFGGPAAHIALMRQEVVQRRKWVTEQQFLDLLGASNLIPGPTSTELAIYLGYRRAGPLGLLLAGVLFILPAMVLVLAFAWAYVEYGSTPQVGGVLYGVKPVIIAVIVQAIYGLLRTAVKSWALALVVVLTMALYAAGFNPLVALFGLGGATMLVQNRGNVLGRSGPRNVDAVLMPPLAQLQLHLGQLAPSAGQASFS